MLYGIISVYYSVALHQSHGDYGLFTHAIMHSRDFMYVPTYVVQISFLFSAILLHKSVSILLHISDGSVGTSVNNTYPKLYILLA